MSAQGVGGVYLRLVVVDDGERAVLAERHVVHRCDLHLPPRMFALFLGARYLYALGIHICAQCS